MTIHYTIFKNERKYLNCMLIYYLSFSKPFFKKDFISFMKKKKSKIKLI